ncbi:MAG: hypothetical protein QHC90_13360 [Shinella sp.]|nr:hypothetical protein [Shinella sp.]
MGESHLIQRCMAALHAKYVLSDDEARGMTDVVLSTAQAVEPRPRGAMGYLHRLKGSEDWNISLPYGMATAWEYKKLFPSNIEIIPLYTEAGNANDDEIKSSEAMARWIIDQWRISCDVEFIPSVDILEGHISVALASHTSALAERDAEIADLKESVIALCGPWASAYAKERGLPEGHLHPTHFDLLEKCGARMDDFTRAEEKAGA